MKPRGGVPKPFVPHLTPGSSGFVFLLLFKSKTKFCFVLFFLRKKKNLYLGLVFIIYGYFVISKSLEMESCSQKSLYKDPFTAVNFILGVLDTVSCVVLPRACTNRHGSSLSLSLW